MRTYIIFTTFFTNYPLFSMLIPYQPMRPCRTIAAQRSLAPIRRVFCNKVNNGYNQGRQNQKPIKRQIPPYLEDYIDKSATYPYLSGLGKYSKICIVCESIKKIIPKTVIQTWIQEHAKDACKKLEENLSMGLGVWYNEEHKELVHDILNGQCDEHTKFEEYDSLLELSRYYDYKWEKYRKEQEEKETVGGKKNAFRK